MELRTERLIAATEGAGRNSLLNKSSPNFILSPQVGGVQRERLKPNGKAPARDRAGAYWRSNESCVD